MINSRNSQKNSRYFTKTQENFRKTQVFANSELEIVAEKRPKKEPALMDKRPFGQIEYVVIDTVKPRLKRKIDHLSFVS